MFKLSYIIECAISAVQILPHLFEKISADLIEIIKNFLLCLFDQFYIVHTHILSTFDISILSSSFSQTIQGVNSNKTHKISLYGVENPCMFLNIFLFYVC